MMLDAPGSGDPAGRQAVATLIDLDDFISSCRNYGAEWGRRRRSSLAAPIATLATAHRAAECTEIPPDEWLVTFEGSNADELTGRAIDLAHAVRSVARDQAQGGVTVSVSRPFTGQDATTSAARHARELIGYKLMLGGDTIIHQPPPTSQPPQVPDQAATALATAARFRDHVRLVKLIVGMCSGVRPADLPGTVASLLLTLLDSGCTPRRRNGGTNWVLWGSLLARLPFAELATIHEMSNLSRWIDRAVTQVLQSLPEPMAEPVDRAEAYLLAHYGDPNLTLNAVARDAHVSPYYLAHLFSKERGTTYRRTLSAIRMRAASRLLTDGTLPVAKVAAAVGFASAKQFRNTFRQAFGCSPSAFRSTQVTVAPAAERRAS